MIRGIGVDMVSVKRMDDLLKRRGERFCNRVFTREEISYCKEKPRPAEHFAARFAAKEALIKAMPSGISLNWQEVEVKNCPAGPRINIFGNMAYKASQAGIESVHVSLTHEDEWAVAFVITWGDGKEEGN